MIADFRKGKLNKVFVNGNGESIYFASDEKTGMLTGMNNVLCSNIIIRFKEGKVSNISFIKQPDGNFIPPHEIEAENTKLSDFSWRANEKPVRSDVVKKIQDPVPNSINSPVQQKTPASKKPGKKRSAL